MACKKSELVSAINSFGTARASGDANLIAFSGDMVVRFLDTLEFEPEDEAVETEEAVDDSAA